MAARGVLLIFGLVLMSCAGPAARPWGPGAVVYGFAGEDIAALERQRILITGETLPQIFSAYVDTKVPIFITSDSVLNAFHVLFEASMARVESKNIRDLLPAVRELNDHLAGLSIPLVEDPKLWSVSLRRAKFIVGVALRLAGDVAGDPGDLTDQVESETAAVVKSTGIRKPPELGPPDPGFLALDYRRFRPRGFYDSSEEYRRYFRSMAWLQAIPFRRERNEELVAFYLLARGASGVGRPIGFRTGFQGLGSRIQEFLPPGIAPDLARSVNRGHFKCDREETHPLADLRKRVDDHFRDVVALHHGSDQVRGLDEAVPSLRLVAPAWTPEVDLFSDISSQPGSLPSGLDVTALLGSPLALELRPEVRKQAKRLSTALAGPDTYRAYLRCLQALADPPEPDAPAFLSGRAWSIKSCNTMAAGWTQLRHTMALYVNPWVNVFGGPEHPVGFVEPDPEFFARLGRLARDLGRSFEDARVLAPDMTDAVLRVKKLVNLIEERDLVRTPGNWNGRVAKEFEDLLGDGIPGVFDSHRPDLSSSALVTEDIVSGLKFSILQMEKGELPTWCPMKFHIIWKAPDVQVQWARLESLCVRLEALAHKQLRGVEWSASDKGFLMEFGHELARIMLFNGSAWHTPPKFRPQVVTVASDPLTGRHLHAGVAGARAMYVLYPTPEGDVLCRGAVMPYYEFVQTESLTDSEWATLLESNAAPSTPDWLRPLESPTRTSVPAVR